MTEVNGQMLEARIVLLEQELRRIEMRLNETADQTSLHGRILAELGGKLDGLREDLKEIKAIPERFMPRLEVETRLRFNEERIEELQEAVRTITTSVHANHVEVNKDLHKNTVATYGTLISVLLTGLGLIITLIQLIPHK